MEHGALNANVKKRNAIEDNKGFIELYYTKKHTTINEICTRHNISKTTLIEL